MEPWEKLIKALAEIWAAEDIQAGKYKEVDVELVEDQGDCHGNHKQPVRGST